MGKILVWISFNRQTRSTRQVHLLASVGLMGTACTAESTIKASTRVPEDKFCPRTQEHNLRRKSSQQVLPRKKRRKKNLYSWKRQILIILWQKQAHGMSQKMTWRSWLGSLQ